MAKVTKNYPKLSTTNRILFEDKTILAHIKDSNIHLTKEEKEMIDNMLENGFIPGSGSGSSEIDWDKINELLKEKADVNHTHNYTSEDIKETDNKRFVSNQDIEKWNNIIENIEPDHIHNNISVLDKIAEDSDGNPLYDGKALKGRDGKDGDSGVFVGDVNDAPLSANIVIDDSDEGFFFEGIVPNIQVGEVATLEPGEQATVTRSGTKENPVFNFGIPKGEKGAGENIALVTTEIVDNTLTLTTDKYQTTTMEDNTTIVLPEVEELTEIYLIFNTASELTVILPDVRWYKPPTLKKDKINKFIFTYVNGEWLGEHFSYNNSIKTPIMDGLICWLDGYDIPVTVNNKLTNETTWENKVQGGEDAIIRTIVGNEVVGIESGYFRTNGNGYVQLPSFVANNKDGVSVFVDAKINKRPTTSYDRVFGLGFGAAYNQGFSMMYGSLEFGYTRSFNRITTSGLFGALNGATFPMPIKVGATTKKAKNYINDLTLMYKDNTVYNSTFTNNFLNAENPTTLNTGDISYGLVLIYNRELTEEEMLHNYMYSLSIERGE